LLLTNSDFRLFLQDLNILGRQVFADTANKLSEVAETAAKEVEPSYAQVATVQKPGADAGKAPTTDALTSEVADIAATVTDAAKTTGQEAASSFEDHILSGSEKETLIARLKAAVTKLRHRNDYSESVSVIGLLIRRYAKVYSRAADKTIKTVVDDVDTNEDLDKAVRNGWSLITSFGSQEAWREAEDRFKQVVSHADKDPEFEDLMNTLASSVQRMLTDPNFFDEAGEKVHELSEKSNGVGSDTPLKRDIEQFIKQCKVVYDSVINDQDVSKIFKTTMRIWKILSPARSVANRELIIDSYTVFLPLFIQAIQYIPIPRLEISVPEIDLLLENLILEPGKTVNHSSFLPFKLNINTNNDLTVRKAKARVVSNLTTLVTTNIQGMSIRADEVGFWFRAHKGIFRLADEGIASFQLDERGMDIAVDFEVGKDRLEKILSLRKVRVKIHHLNYTLSKSKFACLAWIFKPILRPIIRKTLEHKIATAIEEGLHAANRELVYARERLRATRISNPDDIRTFIRAIVTRLTPEEDPDLYTNVGITGGANQRKGTNPFVGVYTPGSVVKLVQDEGQRAGEVVEDNEVGRWRNEVFDVPATTPGSYL
jgi:hypothetical protein